MAALIELKYFNTFWLKKIKKITDVTPGYIAQVNNFDPATRIILMNSSAAEDQMNVGQEVTIKWQISGTPVTYKTHIVERIDTPSFGFRFRLAEDPPSPLVPSLPQQANVGKIINFDNIPQGYSSSASDADDDWLIEES